MEFASIITNKWNINQKTMIIIDTGNKIGATVFPSDVAVVLYSIDYEPEVSSEYLCDEKNRVQFHPTTMLMILDDNESRLNEALEKHYKWTNYKIGTLVIIYVTGNDDCENWLKDLFGIFWSRNIVTVIVSYWSNETLIWFTFNGFKEELYNKTGEYDFTDLLSNIALDLYGFKLRSCFVHDPPGSILKDIGNENYLPTGIEGKSFEVTTKMLNISNHTIKSFPPNTNPVAALQEYVKTNKCDVIFSSSSKFGSLRGMTNLYPLYQDYLCIMIPKGKQYSGLEKLMLPFQPAVWFLVISSLCAIFLYWQLIGSWDLPWRSDTDDHRLIVDYLFGLLLNLGHPVPFQNLTQSSRVFVASIGFFGLLLSYAYQCLLFGFLAVPAYHKDIDTLKEVGLSGIYILTPEVSLKAWFKMNVSSEYPKEFIESLRGEPHDKFYNLLNSDNKSFGYALRRSTIEAALVRNKMQPVFYQVDECMQPLFRVQTVACNFPFTSRIEEITQWLKQAGLTDHWKYHSGPEHVTANISKDDKYDDSGPIAFPLHTLIGLIKFWVAGLFISSYILILEFVWWYLHDSS